MAPKGRLASRTQRLQQRERRAPQATAVMGDTDGPDSHPNGSPTISTDLCTSCIVPSDDQRIVYTGRWAANYTSSGVTHSTTQRGAMMTFGFNGSWVMVFGIVPGSGNGTQTNSSRAVRARYIIDDFYPTDSVLPRATTALPVQPFFSASGLGPEDHRLTIEVLDAPSSRPFIFQHLFIQPSPDPGSPTGTSPAPPGYDGGPPERTPSNNPPDYDGSDLSFPDASPSNFDQGGEEGKTIGLASQRAMAIALAVVGSLFCVVLIGLTLVFCVRRRRVAERLRSRCLSRFFKYAPQAAPQGSEEGVAEQRLGGGGGGGLSPIPEGDDPEEGGTKKDSNAFSTDTALDQLPELSKDGMAAKEAMLAFELTLPPRISLDLVSPAPTATTYDPPPVYSSPAPGTKPVPF